MGYKVSASEFSRRMASRNLSFLREIGDCCEYQCMKCGHTGRQLRNNVGRRGCANCKGEKIACSLRLSIDAVRLRFLKQGLTLLSNNFFSARENLDYKCLKCGYVGQKTADNARLNGCLRCAYDKASSKNRLSQVAVARAFLDKGLIVQGDYENANTPLAYTCMRCGHNGQCRYGVLSKESTIFGCSRCASRISADARRLSYDEVKRSFLDCDLELLCTDYHSSKASMPYRCLYCGYLGQTSLGNLSGCRKCAGKRSGEIRRYTNKEVQARLAKKNLAWVGGDYSNMRSTLTIECLTCDHRWNTSLISIHNSSYGCSECALTRRSQARRLSLSEVNKRFQSVGLTLLSNSYKNVDHHLWYICHNGHIGRTNVSTINLGSGCRECANQAASQRLLTPQHEVIKRFAERNLLLLDFYMKARKPMKYKCLVCGHFGAISLGNLHKKGCAKCGRKMGCASMKTTRRLWRSLDIDFDQLAKVLENP